MYVKHGVCVASTHWLDGALMAGCMGLQTGQQNAQRHFVAVRFVQRVASVLGPTRLAIVAAQNCIAQKPSGSHCMAQHPGIQMQGLHSLACSSVADVRYTGTSLFEVLHAKDVSKSGGELTIRQEGYMKSNTRVHVQVSFSRWEVMVAIQCRWHVADGYDRQRVE